MIITIVDLNLMLKAGCNIIKDSLVSEPDKSLKWVEPNKVIVTVYSP